ncbi:MAG: hypothetical protein ACLRWP_11120 [Bilophila wadsworthia]
MRDEFVRLLVRNAPPGSLTHALARLGAPDMALDDCTAIAEAIGDDLGKQRPGSIIRMECALRFLIAWGERHLYTAGGSESCLYGRLALTFQSMCILANRHIPLAFRLSSIAYELAGYGGNERFRPLIGILKSYMRLLCLELPEEPWNISEIETEFLRLKDACEQEMKNHIACFAGLLYAISGNYPDLLRSHVHQGEPGDWLNRIALFHAMSISQSAMYLGRYTLAIGTVESARHSAELAGEKTFSLLWLTHFCFLLLRKGDWDEALNHLDFLFSCTHPVENPKIFSSTVRGLALYHYLNGRLDAAYRILRRETENAIAAGSPHSPLSIPIFWICCMVHKGGVSRDPPLRIPGHARSTPPQPQPAAAWCGTPRQGPVPAGRQGGPVGCGGNRSRKPPPPKRGLPRLFPGRAGIGPVPP